MNILLVDDHADHLDALAGFIGELGHEVRTAGDGREALDAIRSKAPELVISDLRMPGMDGLQLLAALEEFESPPPLALITAYADAEVAIAAMRHGARDFLRKPIDLGELHRLITNVSASLAADLKTPTGRQSVEPGPDGIIVAGPAMAAVVALADRLHEFPGMPALIEAETGCGKELIAKRVHHGGRGIGNGPFVAVNCAAIPQGLFEAELFGYAPGAFTGAAAGGAAGRFVQAGDGTIFLDEIGELPLEQQAKLLRVLEERSFFPVGGTKLAHLNARVICATNRDLFHEAAQGRFREDLLYRLKVGFVRIPPLRERRDEILPLAHAMLISTGAESSAGGFRGIDPDAATWLHSAEWPGNVRQLRHVLSRALLVRHASESQLTQDLLERSWDDPSVGRGSRDRPPVAVAAKPVPQTVALPATPEGDINLPAGGFDLDAWHRAIIAAALKRCHGSPVRTASYLGVSRKVLYTLRRRYGLMDES